MSYYEGEKSIGLKPLVLGLSVVAMIGFGFAFFTVSHTTAEGMAPEVNTVQQQVMPVQPTSSTKHSRV